jgi:mannosyltransferase OCH1-like enzyme
MSDLALKCIDSWKKILPDYELKLWNEDNFSIHDNVYVKEAYEAKKYAFVADYFRLWVLNYFGGIYMDTDVEVLKPLDDFLSYPAFSGFQDNISIPTGIMASEKGGKWVKDQLEYYNDRHFILPDGSMDITTNVMIITESMTKEGFLLNNTQQNFYGHIQIFPKHFFCAKSLISGKITVTSDTYTIHHFAGSWTNKGIFYYLKQCLHNLIFYLFGEKLYFKIVNQIRLLKKRNHI